MQDPKKSVSKKKNSIWKKEGIKTVVIIITILIITFGGFFMLKIIMNTEMPMVVVTSESMAPNIKTGDLLFVRGIPPESIKNGTHEDKIGSIIIYDSYPFWHSDPNYDPIVHRVIGKWYNISEGKWYFKAQGDANSSPDPPRSVDYPIPEDNIIGVVVGRIPNVGYLKIWFTDTGLAIPLIAFLALLLVISIVWDISHPEEEEEVDQKEFEEERDFDSENVDLGV
jgi:signal peptidase I